MVSLSTKLGSVAFPCRAEERMRHIRQFCTPAEITSSLLIGDPCWSDGIFRSGYYCLLFNDKLHYDLVIDYWLEWNTQFSGKINCRVYHDKFIPPWNKRLGSRSNLSTPFRCSLFVPKVGLFSPPPWEDCYFSTVKAENKVANELGVFDSDSNGEGDSDGIVTHEIPKPNSGNSYSRLTRFLSPTVGIVTHEIPKPNSGNSYSRDS